MIYQNQIELNNCIIMYYLHDSWLNNDESLVLKKWSKHKIQIRPWRQGQDIWLPLPHEHAPIVPRKKYCFTEVLERCFFSTEVPFLFYQLKNIHIVKNQFVVTMIIIVIFLVIITVIIIVLLLFLRGYSRFTSPSPWMKRRIIKYLGPILATVGVSNVKTDDDVIV